MPLQPIGRGTIIFVMYGMLLCAGHGERMEPLSSLIAKPVLDVLGKPLLASSLQRLIAVGCQTIVANLHRHPEQVEAAVRAVATGLCELNFSWEPELLGGAGGVAAVRPWFGKHSVLVVNSDVWHDIDLLPLAQAQSPDSVVLGLLPHPNPDRWSSVELEESGAIGRILPPGAPAAINRYLYAGFQVLGAQAVARLPDPPSNWRPYWDQLHRHGQLRGVVLQGQWREAGTPYEYWQLNLDLLGQRSWVHPHAQVSSEARLECSFVGAGCRVDRQAEVSRSVVIKGAVVPSGARVRDSIVAGAVTLQAKEEICNCLILPHGRFPDHFVSKPVRS